MKMILSKFADGSIRELRTAEDLMQAMTGLGCWQGAPSKEEILAFVNELLERASVGGEEL